MTLSDSEHLHIVLHADLEHEFTSLSLHCKLEPMAHFCLGRIDQEIGEGICVEFWDN